MAPAGLYTFYRAIMTVSNEVKPSSPSSLSSVSLVVRPPFATLSLRFSAPYRGKVMQKRKEKKKIKREKLRKELRSAGRGCENFINMPITLFCNSFRPVGAKVERKRRRRCARRFSKNFSRTKKRPRLNIKGFARMKEPLPASPSWNAVYPEQPR